MRDLRELLMVVKRVGFKRLHGNLFFSRICCESRKQKNISMLGIRLHFSDDSFKKCSGKKGIFGISLNVLKGRKLARLRKRSFKSGTLINKIELFLFIIFGIMPEEISISRINIIE